MRSLLGLLLLAGCITPVLGQNAKKCPVFDNLPHKLRKITAISNHDPGWGGSNDFYKLSKEFLKKHTITEFRFMLNDRNPIVRAMGLLCLAQSNADEHDLELLLHTDDTEEIYLKNGCIISRITIGEFAQQLLRNPYFLEPEGKVPALAIEH